MNTLNILSLVLNIVCFILNKTTLSTSKNWKQLYFPSAVHPAVLIQTNENATLPKRKKNPCQTLYAKHIRDIFHSLSLPLMLKFGLESIQVLEFSGLTMWHFLEPSPISKWFQSLNSQETNYDFNFVRLNSWAVPFHHEVKLLRLSHASHCCYISVSVEDSLADSEHSRKNRQLCFPLHCGYYCFCCCSSSCTTSLAAEQSHQNNLDERKAVWKVLGRMLTEACLNDDLITELEFTETISRLTKDTALGSDKVKCSDIKNLSEDDKSQLFTWYKESFATGQVLRSWGLVI